MVLLYQSAQYMFVGEHQEECDDGKHIFAVVENVARVHDGFRICMYLSTEQLAYMNWNLEL